MVLLGVLAAAVAKRQRSSEPAQPAAPVAAAKAPAREELVSPATSRTRRFADWYTAYCARARIPQARLAAITGLLVASSITSALGVLVQRIGADPPAAVLSASAPTFSGPSHLAQIEGRDDLASDAPVVAPVAPPAPAPAPAASPGRTLAARVSRGAPRSIAPGMWPISGPVTGLFGERRAGHRHPGIDISAPTGTSIVATVPGTVVYAGSGSADYAGYGLLVVIDHGGGDLALYAHMSRVIATRGQQIRPGTVIGLVGSTGHATGPHLHFEVRRGGAVIDPAAWLESRRA